MRPSKSSLLAMSRPLGGDSDVEDQPSSDERQDGKDARAQRFQVDLSGNRFHELEAARVVERQAAIRAGLIADPNKRTTLEDAINFKGTLTAMCPEYEMHQREYQQDVSPLEELEGRPGRIDPAKAVTKFHRPSAGDDQKLPSDVRDPPTLKRTLDYLFHTVMNIPDPALASDPSSRTPQACLRYVHHFLRDRTRAIRQDFTLQSHWGREEAIDCNERIARFHILSMHQLAEAKAKEMEFLKQEAEQLNKTLVTLTHLYDDERVAGRPCPNEPEFRSYQLMSHLHDNEVANSVLILQYGVFSHPLVQLAFDFRALAQRNFDSQKVGSKSNSETSLNFYTRFFKLAKRSDVPFLMAALAQHKFAEVRRAAMRALAQSYPKTKADDTNVVNARGVRVEKYMPLSTLAELLACESEEEAASVAESLDFELVFPEDGPTQNADMPIGVVVNPWETGNDNADAPHAVTPAAIASKLRGKSYQEIIDSGYPTEVSAPTITAPDSGIQRNNTAFPPISKPSFANQHPAQQHRPLQPPSIRPMLNPTAPTFQPLLPSPLHEARAAPAFSFTPPTPKPQTVGQHSPSTTPKPAPSTRTSSVSSFVPAVPTVFPEEGAPTPVRNAPVPASHPPPPPSPKLNVLPIIPRIASKIFVDAIHPFCAAASKSAILEEEQTRRHTEEQFRYSRKENMLDSISNNFYSAAVRGLVDQELATVYADERYRRGVEAKVFRFWKWRAKASQARRLERERHRSKFRTNAKDMSLGASLLGSRSSSDSDKWRRLSDSAMDNQNWDLSLAKSVKEISRRKNILEEGTFASVLGNHICNIPGIAGAVEYEDDQPVWQVALVPTSTPSGEWLRMKFKLDHEIQHDATFHGLSRDGVVSIIDHRNLDNLPSGLCLAVFEYGGNDEFNNLLESIPRRNEYDMGLLLLTWTDEPVKSILKKIDLQAAKAHFKWAHIVNMREDATDQAFDKALHIALPILQSTEQVKLELRGFVIALSQSWDELATVARLVTSQLSQESHHVSAQITHQLLEALSELSDTVKKLAMTLEGDLYHDFISLPSFDVGDVRDEDDFVLELQKFVNGPELRGLGDLDVLAEGPDGLSAADYATRVVQEVSCGLINSLSQLQVQASPADAGANCERLMHKLVVEYKRKTQAHERGVAGLGVSLRPPEAVKLTTVQMTPQANGSSAVAMTTIKPNGFPSSSSVSSPTRKRPHEDNTISVDGSVEEIGGESRIAKLRRAIAKASETMRKVSDVVV